MKFEDFTLVTKASRTKTEAQMTRMSPAQRKRAEQKKEAFRKITLRLAAYSERTEAKQRECILPVLDALRSLVDSPSFEPDKRDRDFLKRIQKLISVRADFFEDVYIRYRTDCARLTENIAERQFHIQKYLSSKYRLTAKEKAERKNRLLRERDEENLALAEASIAEYRAQIEEYSKAADGLKQKIAVSKDENTGVQLLREFKAVERYIAQRNNLIDLNRRIIETVQTEKFKTEKEKLLAKTDTKRQIKLLADMQKLYRKERIAEGIMTYVNQGIDEISKVPVKAEEMAELKKIRAAEKEREQERIYSKRAVITESPALAYTDDGQVEQRELEDLIEN